MRKLLIALGIGAVAAVTVAVTAAQAAPSKRADHHRGPHPGPVTLAVIEHADTDTTTDTGATGDSVGDVLTFANPIYDAKNQHKIGSDNGSCIRTAVGKAYECSWTTTLAGGSLVVEGPFYDTADSTLAITGGTGKYAHARGEMRLHARNAAGSAYDFVFRVIG